MENIKNIYLDILLNISDIDSFFMESWARFSDEIKRGNTMKPNYASFEFDPEHVDYCFFICNT